MYSRQEFLKIFDEMLISNNERQGTLGFLIVKFKQFKDINTAYGFKIGDKFIRRGGDCLGTVLRTDDVISRFGDNEFALLLPGLHNSAHAVLAANKIISECSKVIQCDDIKIEPKLVIGIAIAPEHGNNHDDLIHRATMAVAQAEHTSDRYYMYEPAANNMPNVFTNSALPPRLILEQELHHAFDHDEFCLNYQPKIDLRKKCISGSEVLIRWYSSKYGRVDTQQFIDVLEKTDLLFPVTKWILNSALRQCSQCNTQTANLSVSVNLSPALLNERAVIDIVRGAIKIWDIPPENLVLEVTENAIMRNPELSLEILHDLSSLGVSISIDDYGTGFSSLAYLKDMPASELKIDKSFILNMLANEKNASIVKSTIDMAHSLGMHVIAEGIESEEVLNKLIEMDCDFGQGYFMGRPMSYSEIQQWMQESVWAGI